MDLPAPVELMGRRDLPAPVAPGGRSDLPAPVAPGGRSDLPAAVGPGGRSDLPAAVGPGGRSDLPAAVGPGGRSDLPAAVDSFPTPVGPSGRSDLPASRAKVPYPNLPVSRGPAETGADLPAVRTAVPRPTSGGTAAVALGRMGRTPNPEVLRVDVPAAPNSPLAPLDLGLNLDVSPDDLVGAEVADPDLALGGAGSPYAGGTIYGVPPSPSVPQGGFDPFAPDLADDPSGGAANGDLGFQLAIEGQDGRADQAGATIRPQSALPAIEVQQVEMLGDSVPMLAPHKVEETAKEPVKPRRRRSGLLIGAVAALAAAGAGGYVLLSPTAPKEVPTADVLGPHKDALDRDLFPAYANGAKQLIAVAAAGPADADGLRASAAELLLLARIARQAPANFKDQAEQALAQVLETPNPSASERRARALMALAADKAQRVPALLAGIENTVEGRVVTALTELQGEEYAKAAVTLKAVTTARPGWMLGHYLLGRALESSGDKEKAAASYDRVLSKNADHLGAGLGRVRVTEKEPATRWKSGETLLAKRLDFSTPNELAAVHLFIGQNALTLGRVPEATRAFTQALAADPTSAAANLALGETYLLRDGNYKEALQRYRSAGTPALMTADGKFGIAGALIANGQIGDGLNTLESAIKSWPKDPRGPFFKGWAAEGGVEADPEAAIRHYREALALDKSFVPASLRLASALQRRGRAEESLNVLKAAEQAGAPPLILQIAWGEALITAKQPARAEEVFRKALAGDAKMAPARMGLAAALEAQGRIGEAKMELEEMLAETPDTEGLRERLAAMALRLGEREEAVRHYQAEIDSNRASPAVYVALGRVAMELDNLDLAEKNLSKVANEAPGTPGALFHLGRMWETRGDLGKALQEYRRATQFENTPEVQLAFGKALLKGGREDEALVALRIAESLAEARLEHGRVMMKRGDVERAIADFTAAVALDAQLDEAYLLMGNAFDHVGKTDQAFTAWSNAVRVSPRNGEALYRLGRLEMDRGNPRAALDYLRRAATNVKDDQPWAADVYFQLGYAELGAGSKKNAHSALGRYMALAPEDAPARPAVEKMLERMNR